MNWPRLFIIKWINCESIDSELNFNKVVKIELKFEISFFNFSDSFLFNLTENEFWIFNLSFNILFGYSWFEEKNAFKCFHNKSKEISIIPFLKRDRKLE